MPHPPANLLEDLLDQLRDAALDVVEDFVSVATGRLKDKVRGMTPPQGRSTPQGRRKRVQGKSTGAGGQTGARGKGRKTVISPVHREIRTAYTVLGVLPTADLALLKAAYRAKAGQYHPDTNKDPKAEELMKELNAAWAILSDPKIKVEYDRRLGL